MQEKNYFLLQMQKINNNNNNKQGGNCATVIEKLGSSVKKNIKKMIIK